MVLVFAGLTVLTGCKEEPDTITLPLLAEINATEITVKSAFVKGIILAPGGSDVTARGFCWSTAPDPTINDNKLTEGKGIGHFTGRISGLLPGTDYYVRAYASNMNGTSYSISELIRTPLTVTPATLVTIAPEYITSTGVLTGGIITDIGGGEITERGICWNTDHSPTIDNVKLFALITGAGSGSFTIQVNDFEPGKTYFLRAYAINDAGVSYGPETSFRTPALLGIKRADFPGDSRYHSVTFSIGNKLYLGLGVIVWSDWTPAGDFWEWDQVTNQWTRLAQFPGDQINPKGFVIGGKGYVFTNSWTQDGDLTNEFWEYEPEFNRWTRKSSLPAAGSRYYPVAFSIGSKGYFGMGLGWIQTGNTGDYDEDVTAVYFNDLWEWDQATDVWTRKANFPGPGRTGAAAFTIGSMGYVGTGNASIDEGSLVTDFWEYDQLSDQWTRKADFPGTARSNAVGFSMGNKGYIGAGDNYLESESDTHDFWEWDQLVDQWNKLGTVATNSWTLTGGSVGNNGYLIANPDPENQPSEIWIFPLTSDK